MENRLESRLSRAPYPSPREQGNAALISRFYREMQMREDYSDNVTQTTNDGSRRGLDGPQVHPASPQVPLSIRPCETLPVGNERPENRPQSGQVVLERLLPMFRLQVRDEIAEQLR
jgi:hypothetical protein